MRILLSDGSGLTSRQVATILGRAGHRVEVLDSAGFALTHQTRWVSRVHRAPPLGLDPFAWLRAATELLHKRHFDVLLPTQEQVAVLARRPEAIPVALAVPDFAALQQVQDKISAAATLDRLGLPQPAGTVVTTRDDLLAVDRFPVFVKRPIGTASNGVRRVGDRTQLQALAQELAAGGELDDSVLVQQGATGELFMIQSVFEHGRLVAWHACRRSREGSKGGASSKVSDPRPEFGEQLGLLGAKLNWHGALSADAILTDDGPLYIDINPRLVEPVNALRSGVNLVGALLDVSLAKNVPSQNPGRPGVRTHQLLLALTHAAEHGRRSVARELRHAATRTGPYRHSTEELTPMRGDPATALLIAAVAGTLLISPKTSAIFTGGTVTSYALTPAAWRQLVVDQP